MYNQQYIFVNITVIILYRFSDEMIKEFVFKLQLEIMNI